MSSESQKYTHLTKPYLDGVGVDIGTGGYPPVVPHAIAVELPISEFIKYTGGAERTSPIHLRGNALELPFKDGTLDFVYASHLIEDWSRPEVWPVAFKEWHRVLKHGGNMVLLVPEFKLWNDAIRRGQCPNCSHWAPEPSLGDMTHYATAAGFLTVFEGLTALTPEDYSILGVFRKP